MSYSVQPRRLKKLIDFYYPDNNFQQIKYMKVFGGEQGLLRHLQTSPFQGIDSTSIEQRNMEFGNNQIWHQAARIDIKQILSIPFKELPPKIILFLTILSLFLGIFLHNKHIQLPWIEGTGYLIIMLIIFSLLLVPEIQMQLQNHAIKSYNQKICECIVWRDNQKKTILSNQLVVGDIVELEAGDKVGADGIIIEGHINVIEKIGHLERKAIKKKKSQCIESVKLILSKKKFIDETKCSDRPSPIVLGGSIVQRGECRMMVLCVGKYSQQGYKAMMINNSAQRKISKTFEKINSYLFTFSKYSIITIIIVLILYCIKQAIFILINESLETTNWIQLIQNLCHYLTLTLTGVPYFLFFGLSIGLSYIKFCIWKQTSIYYKYARDCVKIKSCQTVIYQQTYETQYFSLKQWWNEDYQGIIHSKIENPSYEETFLKSLTTELFQPYDYGIQLPSFFIGLSPKQIQSIYESLKSYAKSYKDIYFNEIHQKFKASQIHIQLQAQDSSHQLSVCSEKFHRKYFIGNAQSILKVCSHYYNNISNQIQLLTGTKKQGIQKLIWKNNLNNGLSIINAFVQINPQHPKFRQGNSRIVMIALIEFMMTQNVSEFQAFSNMKKKGYNFLLTSSLEQQLTIQKAKQLGIVAVGKPAVNLKGYDFYNIIGGIICKNCKKSVCICQTQSNILDRVIKNQDQFSTIQKHLCTLSEANMLDKLGLVLGIKNGNPNSSMFLGSKIEDIPSMKISELALCTQGACSQQTKNAAQVILKSGKLSEIEKLVWWSQFCFLFYKKYLILCFVPNIVAFSTNMIGYLFFDTEMVKLIHYLWTMVIICPILGINMSFYDRQNNQDAQNIQLSNRQIKQEQNVFEISSLKQDNTLRQYQKKCENKRLLNKSDLRLIASQSIYQSILLVFIFLFGQYFIYQTEDQYDKLIGDKWNLKYQSQHKNTVCWGVKTNIFAFGHKVYSQAFENYHIYSRHLTFIFNLFVLMQFMNFLICRICHKSSLNVFQGFDVKIWALLILGMGCQIICIQFSAQYFGLYPLGLTLIQWSICFGLSLSSCIFGLIIKQIPIGEQNQHQKYFRLWPNRAYNLAVKAVAPREDLLDFQIDDDFEFEQKVRGGHQD